MNALQSCIPNNPNPRAIVEDNIAKGYADADELLLGDKYRAFKEEITKGIVAPVTPAEIAADYGGKFFTPEQKAAFEKGLDNLLKKGEDPEQGWTEAEETAYTTMSADLNRLERRAVPIQKGEVGGPIVYAEVYILKKEVTAE